MTRNYNPFSFLCISNGMILNSTLLSLAVLYNTVLGFTDTKFWSFWSHTRVLAQPQPQSSHSAQNKKETNKSFESSDLPFSLVKKVLCVAVWWESWALFIIVNGQCYCTTRVQCVSLGPPVSFYVYLEIKATETADPQQHFICKCKCETGEIQRNALYYSFEISPIGQVWVSPLIFVVVGFLHWAMI